MSAVVKLEDVHKSFGALKVLNGVSFEVQKAQVVAIVGRSGSGKSTALRCINRLETVDSGRIEVCGHEVSSAGVDLNALRRDVGIVFQSYNLFPHLTVEENISLGPRYATGCRVGRSSVSRWRCWRGSAWPRRRGRIPNSYPEGNSNAWPSRGRWPCRRR